MQTNTYPRITVRREQARGIMASLTSHSLEVGRKGRRVEVLTPARRASDGSTITYDHTRLYVFK